LFLCFPERILDLTTFWTREKSFFRPKYIRKNIVRVSGAENVLVIAKEKFQFFWGHTLQFYTPENHFKLK